MEKHLDWLWEQLEKAAIKAGESPEAGMVIEVVKAGTALIEVESRYRSQAKGVG